MDVRYRKPLPRISVANQPYWDAAKAHELRLQRCNACGKLFHPIGPHCQHCWSEDFEWERLSGKGTVNAFTIYHQPFHEAYIEEVPYNVVEVQLEEGPRLITNLVDVDNAEIKIGMPVEAEFEDVTDEITLIKFRPMVNTQG